MISNYIALYWHTLRYLKPVQFYGRLWFRFYRPRVDSRPAPPMRALAANWQIPAQRASSLLTAERFYLLGEEGSLGEVGWDSTERSKLWHYNQHYFDDLNAEGTNLRADWHQRLLSRWVGDNPPGQGVGWEPYPTSLRIVNWVKWALAANCLPDDYVESLAVQARWLSSRLETHLLGNHLFANAKALVFAGCYFDGPEAEQWLSTGFHILAREIPEQILSDGGQFERSTMYHSLALEDMLDLLNLLRCFKHQPSSGNGKQSDELLHKCVEFQRTWPALIEKMVAWLALMCHPDGEIGFFNDAAFGIAPPTQSLIAYAKRLGLNTSVSLTPVLLTESGYIRLCNETAVLLFDAAPVGPDYLPGHAHADSLSVELSVFGQRVLVNSGTSQYGLEPERLRQRGTPAHNTVVVNNENSSEVWSGFRVARRARVHDVKAQLHGAALSAEASHDGYTRLNPPITVRRRVNLEFNSLLIEDDLRGDLESAVAHFHLHPSVSVQETYGGSLELLLSDGQSLSLGFRGASKVVVEDSTWHPRFGAVEANRRLRVEFSDRCLETRLAWSAD